MPIPVVKEKEGCAPKNVAIRLAYLELIPLCHDGDTVCTFGRRCCRLLHCNKVRELFAQSVIFDGGTEVEEHLLLCDLCGGGKGEGEGGVVVEIRF